MTLDETTLDKITLDKKMLDETTLDKTTLDEMALYPSKSISNARLHSLAACPRRER
jgi:hypothetical protein